MLINHHRILASTDSPLAPSGGQNGAGQPKADPMAVLAAMVAQRDSVPAVAPDESPQESAQDSPEEPSAPALTGEPGKETLTPETEPAADGAEPEADGEQPTNDPSPEQTELTTALADLSPTERKAALDLVKTLQPGEIPRIAKLVAQRHQLESTVEDLQKQLETAQSEAVERPLVNGPGRLPESIAKLKTVEAVQQRYDEVEANADALTDFLDENPGDSETRYKIGEQEFSRKQLIERRAGLRAELKLLPKRGQQITQAAQFAHARQEASQAAIKRFPVLADPENPVTRKVRQLAALPQFASEPNGDELAYYFVLGKQVAEARKANGAANPPQRPVNPKIPLGKPHVAANGAAGRGPDAARINAAMEAHGKDRSLSSFAAVLEATGR